MVRDLIIVGAGPSGLSAAIAAKRRSLDYQVLEQGALVNSIYRFPPNMVFFTTPELLEIGGLPFITPYDKPTRVEALRYYRRVVDTYDLQIAFEEKVLSIGAEGADGAQVLNVETRSGRGVRRVRHARNVIIAIGYYDRPNLLGVPGEDLPHVHHYYVDPHPYYRQRVVVVGGGNSAAEASLALFRAGASVTLVHRNPRLKPTIKYWVRPDIENRIKEGSIPAFFSRRITEIRPTTIVVAPCEGRLQPVEESSPSGSVGALHWPAVGEREAPSPAVEDTSRAEPPCSTAAAGAPEELPAYAVFLLTGYRADADLMIGAGVELNHRQAPVFDPQTFETNVPGLFVAGGAIAGVDTGTIFIENGRFHGEKIVEVIARRLDRASEEADR